MLADVLLAVAVARRGGARGARAHRGERAHSAERLEPAFVRLDELAGRLVHTREDPAKHDRGGSRTDGLRDVAGVLDASVRAHRDAMAVGDLGAVEDRGDLWHARARDDSRRADRAGTHADLHAVGPRRDELLGALGGRDVAGDDLHAVPRLHLLDHADDGGGMSVRRVDDEHVDSGADERGRAFIRVAGDTHRGSDEDVGILGATDLVRLFEDGEVPVNDAEAAQATERDREGRVGDRVHRGGEDRDVQADLVRETGLGGDLRGEDVAAGRDEEDVVEGEPFFGELVLPGQSAALTRASVSTR